MALRNLHLRAIPFRYAGYSGLALTILALQGTQRPAWALGAGAAGCLIWAIAAHGAGRLAQATSTSTVPFALGLHLAEALLAGALVGWLLLPWLPLLVVITVLLASNAAQAGWWLAWRAGTAMAVGVGAGRLLAVAPVMSSTPAADLTASALLLGYTVGLGLTSFAKAQRLHAAQQDLARRALVTERVNSRLGRYLPPPVRARVRRRPDERCGLERRWLTIAYVDVVGFTELAGRLAPEELAVVVNDYFAASGRLFASSGGTLAGLQGDGLLAYFGNATAATRGRAAVDCVESCLQVSRLLRELSGCWQRRGYVTTLTTRCGVASGYCTVGDWGEERLDFTVIGAPVNLASRLQAHAGHDGILVCESTAALVGQVFPLGAERELVARGIGRVKARRLESALVDPPPASAKVPRPDV
jgi:class 3 adenylate cyclase